MFVRNGENNYPYKMLVRNSSTALLYIISTGDDALSLMNKKIDEKENKHCSIVKCAGHTS